MIREGPAAPWSLREDLAALDVEPLVGASGVEASARRTAALDRALRPLFPASDRLALVAVGGYGRSELAPGSDVDLLVVHPPGWHSEAEAAFDPVLYTLWDLGMSVGHAVRTPEECRIEAERRLESLTALLDARLLAGPAELLGRAKALVVESVATDLGSLVEELRASMVRREARFGALGETLEPDLRDAVGGLRDVQMFGWLARGLGGADPVERGWLRRSEGAAVSAARDFLLLVRTALHRAAGHRADRLVAEHHDRLASALGFTDEPAAPPAVWERRDAFMRRLFRHGRAVKAAAEGCLDHAADEVIGEHRHLVAVDWTVPTGEGVLGAFARLAGEGGSLSGQDLDRIQAAQGWPGAQPPVWSPRMREAFEAILASGEGGARALGLLDLLGVLGALLPEWAHVRGRPQRDPFHRFPADTHLVRTAAQLARLLFRPDEPLTAASVATVVDPAALLIAGLLHDIGKVGAGSHVAEGVRIAGVMADRMGLDPQTRELVLFLVREHLLLSDTATRRNLEDHDLVLHVAARVGTPERLAALHLLTLADAESTGPSAATPWRLGLVRELVAKVGRAFDRGEMSPDRAAELSRAETEIRAALAAQPPDRADEFLARVPPGYALWVDPGDVPDHLGLISPRPGLGEARSHHRPGRTEGVHLLAVGALDRPGLLANIAGALTLAGLSVLSAQVFTTDDGVVLDAFEVTGAFEPDIGEERWRRFRSHLRRALEGRVHLADRIQRLRTHYRPAATGIEVTVRVDEDASDFFSVVEVGAADRLGLLFDLAGTFAGCGLDVHLAKVATYGPRVVDVFYVTDQTGQKLEPAASSALEAALTAAAAGE